MSEQNLAADKYVKHFYYFFFPPVKTVYYAFFKHIIDLKKKNNQKLVLWSPISEIRFFIGLSGFVSRHCIVHGYTSYISAMATINAKISDWWRSYFIMLLHFLLLPRKQTSTDPGGRGVPPPPERLFPVRFNSINTYCNLHYRVF